MSASVNWFVITKLDFIFSGYITHEAWLLDSDRTDYDSLTQMSSAVTNTTDYNTQWSEMFSVREKSEECSQVIAYRS